MTDLGTTIAPKSDQMNADDLIAGPVTVTVRGVSATNDLEQPISIFYDGDQGKPYKPGKSMRRVLVNCWGRDGDTYVGRSMTLYRDPSIKFGKDEVGGIRIAALSHIERDAQIPLTVTRGSRKPFTVKKLQEQRQAPTITADQVRVRIKDAKTVDDLRAIWRDANKAPWWGDVENEFVNRRAELDPPAQNEQQQSAPETQEDDNGFDAP
ncbi:MAG TPA: hypothetical protein VF638_03060 [Sphingomonas sp.]